MSLVEGTGEPTGELQHSAIVKLAVVLGVFEAAYDDKISSLVSQHYVIAPVELDAKDRTGFHPATMGMAWAEVSIQRDKLVSIQYWNIVHPLVENGIELACK